MWICNLCCSRYQHNILISLRSFIRPSVCSFIHSHNSLLICLFLTFFHPDKSQSLSTVRKVGFPPSIYNSFIMFMDRYYLAYNWIRLYAITHWFPCFLAVFLSLSLWENCSLTLRCCVSMYLSANVSLHSLQVLGSFLCVLRCIKYAPLLSNSWGHLLQGNITDVIPWTCLTWFTSFVLFWNCSPQNLQEKSRCSTPCFRKPSLVVNIFSHHRQGYCFCSWWVFSCFFIILLFVKVFWQVLHS